MLIDNFEKFKEAYGYGRYFLHFVAMGYALRIVGALVLILGISLGGWGLWALPLYVISVILHYRAIILKGKVTAYIEDGELIERTMEKIHWWNEASFMCLTLAVVLVIVSALI